MKTLNFQVRLPEHTGGTVEDKEHFFLTRNGQEQKILLHDYTIMYQNPGLYEYLCYQHLSYQSPRVLASLLIEQLTQAQEKIAEVQLLDLAAGSGLTARELSAQGIKNITGIDIYPEAGEAAQRESPDLFEKYYVEDLADVKEETALALRKKEFNCLVCCSALPALPASAFVTAFNIIRPNAWVAFNVLKEIWEDSSADGFFARHPWAVDHDVFELREQMYSLRRYTTHGRPLEEIIVVGTKKGNVV